MKKVAVPTAAISFDEVPNQSLISLGAACQLTGISRSSIYRHIKCGNLKLVKLGKLSRINAGQLRFFMGIK